MKILALETCYGKFSVGIYFEQKQISYLKTDEPHKQAEQLIPSIEKLLAEAKIDYKDLDAIAVAIGPGSFTGLRVGLAAAKGIVLATGIKGIGVSTLQAVALAKGGGEIYLPSGHKDAFAQKFDSKLNPISEPSLILDYSGPFDPIPNADLIAKTAEFSSFDLQPLYIRKPDAKLPGQKSA